MEVNFICLAGRAFDIRRIGPSLFFSFCTHSNLRGNPILPHMAQAVVQFSIPTHGAMIDLCRQQRPNAITLGGASMSDLRLRRETLVELCASILTSRVETGVDLCFCGPTWPDRCKFLTDQLAERGYVYTFPAASRLLKVVQTKLKEKHGSAPAFIFKRKDFYSCVLTSMPDILHYRDSKAIIALLRAQLGPIAILTTLFLNSKRPHGAIVAQLRRISQGQHDIVPMNRKSMSRFDVECIQTQALLQSQHEDFYFKLPKRQGNRSDLLLCSKLRREENDHTVFQEVQLKAISSFPISHRKRRASVKGVFLYNAPTVIDFIQFHDAGVHYFATLILRYPFELKSLLSLTSDSIGMSFFSEVDGLGLFTSFQLSSPSRETLFQCQHVLRFIGDDEKTTPGELALGDWKLEVVTGWLLLEPIRESSIVATSVNKLKGDRGEDVVEKLFRSHPGVSILDPSRMSGSPSDFLLRFEGKEISVSVRTSRPVGPGRIETSLQIRKNMIGATPNIEEACDLLAVVIDDRVLLFHKTSPWLVTRWGARSTISLSREECELFEVKHGDKAALEKVFSAAIPFVPERIFPHMNLVSFTSYFVVTQSSLNVFPAKDPRNLSTFKIKTEQGKELLVLVNKCSRRGNYWSSRVTHDCSTLGVNLIVFVEIPRLFVVRAEKGTFAEGAKSRHFQWRERDTCPCFLEFGRKGVLEAICE